VDGVDGFMQAKNYSKGNSRRITQWVIHDEEYPERTDAAWDVARFFAGANAPQASAHACVDDRNAIGCVDWADVAWATGHSACNAASISIEHSGYASQTREEWLDEYGMKMLDRSARLFAEIGHGRYGIPAVKLDPAQVARGESGICGHADVTAGYGIYGGHTDPGPWFPWDVYLDLINKYIGGETTEQEDEMKSIMVLDPDSKTGEVWECWGLFRKHIASEADRDLKKFFGVQYFGPETAESFRRFAIRTTKSVDA
jgi:N-acetyl-anhydromuramyl-L-alanine amidase AmpD